MKTIKLKIIILSINLFFWIYSASGQCATNSNIYSFVHNGKSYEIVKENKTWINSAACAVQRGGILAEINDINEQNEIFNQLNSNAGINVNNTTAADGGGASYVWIGGNDLSVEGNWIWDGDNDNIGTQFWMGDLNGSAIGGLYNNWGNEPDDYFGQDALGLALTNWPLGVAGEWNDVAHTNTLYFIIEYSTLLSTEDLELENIIDLYPNPVLNYLTIKTNEFSLKNIAILNSLGQEIKVIDFRENSNLENIDLSALNVGIYYVKIRSDENQTIIKKLVKK